MDFEALNKYLEATQDHLGVEHERYGGGFRAIVAHRAATELLFDMLSGGDLEAVGTQAFLGENPLFPSAWGSTPQEALKNLDTKLNRLYTFEPSNGVFKWTAQRKFVLKAQYDAAPGEGRDWYDVQWLDVVLDLRPGSDFYYENAKVDCGTNVKRNFHALLTFKYEGDFATL